MEPNITESGIWDKLSERQIQAVNYKILNPDASYGDIEAALDIPKGTIKNWRLNQIVGEIRKDAAKAANDYANRLLLKAYRVLERQLDSDDEKISQTAAKDIIDRAVGKANQNSTISNPDGSNLLEGLIININDKSTD
jgi:hypothetical protein